MSDKPSHHRIKKAAHLKLVKPGEAPAPITRDLLLRRLSEVLREFEDENTCVAIHLSFHDLSAIDSSHRADLWWDENLLQWVPFDPEDDGDEMSDESIEALPCDECGAESWEPCAGPHHRRKL